MDDKVNETINELCDWIQKELENARGTYTDCVLPAVIEATAKLIEANRV